MWVLRRTWRGVTEPIPTREGTDHPNTSFPTTPPSQQPINGMYLTQLEDRSTQPIPKLDLKNRMATNAGWLLDWWSLNFVILQVGLVGSWATLMRRLVRKDLAEKIRKVEIARKWKEKSGTQSRTQT